MAVDEQLRVQIAPGGARGLEINPHTITDESGFVAPQFASLGAPFVFLRLTPPVLATLRATIGSVEQVGVRDEVIPAEAVVFNGTAEASTEHRVHSGLQVAVQGTAFDVDGNAILPSITADAAGRLTASQPFHGAAIVSYTTRYRLLKYRYEVQALSPGVIGGGGSRITGGTVLAFHDGQVASFQLPAPELPQEEPDTAEVYRDVSYSIVQEGEAYERPEGWPDETWPDGSPDPDEGWVEVERVHAIGRMEGFCRLAIEREYVAPAAPMKNSNTYTIPLERIVATDEALAGRGFGAGCIARAKAQIPEALG